MATNLMQGFAAGQAIGGGLRTAFSDRPAAEEAMKQIQQGADPNAVLQQLYSTSPRAAEMLAGQIGQMQTQRANQMQLRQAQQQMTQRQNQQQINQQFNQALQQGAQDGRISFNTIRKLTLIDSDRANELLSTLSATGQQEMQFVAQNLAGAAGMTNGKAQRRVLSDVAAEIEGSAPALSQQLKDIASTENDQQRQSLLRVAIETMGESGYVPGSGRKQVQSSQPVDGGVRVVYRDGTTEFVPASEREIKAAQEFRQSQLPKLSAGLEKTQIAASEQVAKDSQQLGKIDSLIAGFDQMEQQGGITTSLEEFARQQLGEENAGTMLRQQFAGLVNSEVINNLPPGVASDRDIALAREGFPSKNASPQYIASFLRGMKKMIQYRSMYNRVKAEFIPQAGNAYLSKRDFTIDGVQVKAGDTLDDVVKKVLEGQGGGSQEQAMPQDQPSSPTGKTADDYINEARGGN